MIEIGVMIPPDYIHFLQNSDDLAVRLDFFPICCDRTGKKRKLRKRNFSGTEFQRVLLPVYYVAYGFRDCHDQEIHA